MACCIVEDASKRARCAEKYPESIEVVLNGDDKSFPSMPALFGELGLKFAERCGELSSELDVDPTELAEAYTDPTAYDASGKELEFPSGIDLKKLPLIFRFQRQARKNHIMVGLSGAGKSTILRRLKLSVDRDVTILMSAAGFQVETLWLDDFACIVAWDCPVCEKDSLTWRAYLRDAVSVIFVIDSGARECFEAASIELAHMLNEEELADAVLLVYANKQDAAQAVTAAALTKVLGLRKLRRRRWFVQPGCASSGDGIFQGIGHLTAMLKMGRVGDDEPEPDLDAGASSSDEAAHVAEASRIAEVVLDCVHDDEIDFTCMPPRSRAIVFNVPRDGPFQALVGRLHQPGFFELLLQRQERVLAISRAHFSISWDSSNEAMMLQQLSKNRLCLDNTRLLRHGEIAHLFDGTWIGFKDPRDGESPFLVFRVGLRTHRDVEEDGPFLPPPGSAEDSIANPSHDYVSMQTMRLTSQTFVSAEVQVREILARLRCVHACGCDVTSMPTESRDIDLALNIPFEIGRLCQVGFFESLLRSEPSWLCYLSRKHCRLRLSASIFDRQKLSLSVQNLSGNVVFVCGHPVAQHQSSEMTLGATLGFASTVDGKTVQFLEFVFQRLDVEMISV